MAKEIARAPRPTDELALRSICGSWLSETEGPRFVESTLTFLANQSNKNTRRAYGISLVTFFRWARKTLGRTPVPRDVTRAEALAYTEWLYSDTEGLTEEKLEEDPNRQDDLLIYRAIKARGSMKRSQIDALATSAPSSRALKRLVKNKVIDGIGGIYKLHRQRRSPPGPTRASTVALRLTALSAYWDWLATESVENRDNFSEPLLKYNIWRRPLKKATKQSGSMKAAARIHKTPNSDIFCRLLATTYEKTMGEDALEAAQMALEGSGDTEASTARPNLRDARDRAVLLFLAYTGCRASEIGQIRRSSLRLDPPIVTVIGKGSKARTFRIPQTAMSAIETYLDAIDQKALTPKPPSQKTVFDALCHPDAPLFGPLRFSRRPTKTIVPGNIHGLRPNALTQMLRNRAKCAGIEPGSSAWQRIHPHGLRHLAAKEALKRGVPLPTIQAVLGHSSLSTTGQYVEEHDPENLSLRPES